MLRARIFSARGLVFASSRWISHTPKEGGAIMIPELKIFDFEEMVVRVYIDENDAPWWHAGDVCRVLQIENSRDAVARLDDDERDGVGSTDAIGREQRMNVINEPGLYTLVLGSRKPEAKRFKRWVTHEVLPALRKTGKYIDPAARLEAAGTMSLRELQLWRFWLDAVASVERRFGIEASRRLWRQSPLPQPPEDEAEAAADNTVARFVWSEMERNGMDNVPLAEIAERYNTRHPRHEIDSRRIGVGLRAAGLDVRLARNGGPPARSLIGFRWKRPGLAVVEGDEAAATTKPT